MPEQIPIPHADVPIGGTKNITLIARDKNRNLIPNAIFSDVVYTLDNQVGNIVPNLNNPALAVFTGFKAGNANLLVQARITIPS